MDRVQAIHARGALSVLLAACFLLYSVLPLNVTRVGLQCPTAPIQKIVVAVKDCCGKVEGLALRAPKPGEKGFLQCNCAEKKSSTQKTAVTSKTVPILLVAQRLPDISPLELTGHTFDYCDRFQSLDLAPPLLPPV